MTARDLTLVMPYYDNPTMLKRHVDLIASFPKETREHITMIVTDDGSPRWPARPPDSDPGFRVELYRIKVDVRWNQDAAKNLAVHHAKSPWLLLTDIDHMVPLKTMEHLVWGAFEDSVVYRFSRVNDPAMEPYKPHPNSWWMTRAMYERIGGYDERFAGYYGTDAEFRDRVRSACNHHVVMLADTIIRVPREVTPDASTTTYQRKSPEDNGALRRIREERDKEPGWRPLRLSFPWERVA